jgi:hypothetical protein
MGEGGFGELFVDGEHPRHWRHVFASVQSLSHHALEEMLSDHFDVLVVDETHHASDLNASYSRILQHFKPRELLGLTATPERADGQSILPWFDGRMVAEIRLWDAIDRGLLVPFQYYGIHDDVDLSDIVWRAGRYDQKALEARYGQVGAARFHLVCRKVAEYVGDPQTMRALGFCVSVSHAQAMAASFNKADIPATSVTGRTSREDRASAVYQLRSGALKVIFCVDVFNEGVDIPEVDTVLFLRPTESATLFIQQLGRGLRQAPHKRCLTVLDFVGRAHQKFRYDLRFRAITGQSRAKTRDQVATGFPCLPAGCSIELDEISRDIILDNLARGIGHDKRSLVSELKALGPEATLASFLRDTELELSDIYRAGRTFSDLRRAAGFDRTHPGPQESRLGKALGRLIHVDDRARINAWKSLIDGRPAAVAYAAEHDIAVGTGFERMLATALGGAGAMANPGEALRGLAAHPSIRSELLQLLDLRDESLDHEVIPFRSAPGVPIAVHARYTLGEIMAAFGARTKRGDLYIPREGVFYHEPTRCNILLVTLCKDESDYSPTTMYRDYAISPTRFHWQSQSGTRPKDTKGRRHINHEAAGIKPLLFVRATKQDDRGLAVPYTFLGPTRIANWIGERPMSIEWVLDHEMPTSILDVALVASG